MEDITAIDKAYQSIRFLKEKSKNSMKKNFLTITELSNHSGISRNNLSKAYIQDYPEWKNIRNAVDSFKVEFNNMKLKSKDSPIIDELRIQLKNSLEQNLELIKEIKNNRYSRKFETTRYNELLEEKQQKDIELKKYIDRFGLI